LIGPVCYIERSADGVGIHRVRLVGERGSEVWDAGESPPETAPELAAAWIRERLDKDSNGVAAIVADSSGGLCAWMDVPSESPEVLSAAIRQREGGIWGGWSSDDEGPGVAEHGSTSVQALAVAPSRAPVISLPDVSIRVLIDSLDGMGVRVGRVESIWHAMALAWTRSDSSDRDDRFAGSDETDIGVLLIDRDASSAWHALWAWGRGGLLTAGGIARVPEGAIVGVGSDAKQLAGRLSADWLAWSAQIGRSPRRVVCLVPDDDATDPSPLLSAISKTFSDSSIDAVRVPDGTEATLARLAERTPGGRLAREASTDDPRSSLVALGRRPGRSHRAMYRWATLAMLITGGALAALGWKLDSVGSESAERAEQIRADNRAAFAEAFPLQADHAFPSDVINARLNELRQASRGPDNTVRSKPIMEEIDTLSLILNNAGDLQLVDMSFQYELATATVIVPDTETGELLPDMLNGASRHLQWSGQFTRQGGRRGNNNELRYSLTGSWRDSGSGQ